jgi:hypothetical protein
MLAMKSRYLCAVLLLAALALLQARVAFADCLGATTQVSEAACCQVSSNMLDANDAPMARLCVDHCVQPFAPYEPNQKVSVTFVRTPALAANRPVVYPTAVSKISLRRFMSEPQVEGGRHLLLYRLQRLLI